MHSRQTSSLSSTSKRNPFNSLLSSIHHVEVKFPRINKKCYQSAQQIDPNYEIYDQIVASPIMRPKDLQLRLSKVATMDYMRKRLRSKVTPEILSEVSDCSSAGDEQFQYVDDHEHESNLKHLMRFNNGLSEFESRDRQIQKVVKTLYHQKKGIIERSYVDTNMLKELKRQSHQDSMMQDQTVDTYYKSMVTRGKSVEDTVIFQRQQQQQEQLLQTQVNEKRLTNTYHTLHRQNILNLLKCKQQNYGNLIKEKPILTSQYVDNTRKQSKKVILFQNKPQKK